MAATLKKKFQRAYLSNVSRIRIDLWRITLRQNALYNITRANYSYEMENEEIFNRN